jgi:hypothetical protein
MFTMSQVELTWPGILESDLGLVFANARAVADRFAWLLHLLLCHRPDTFHSLIMCIQIWQHAVVRRYILVVYAAFVFPFLQVLAPVLDRTSLCAHAKQQHMHVTCAILFRASALGEPTNVSLAGT